MKKMMGLFIMIALLATGCGKNSDKLGITKGRGSRAADVTPATAQELATPGMVYGDYQDEFQQNVVDFLNPVLPADAVGYVNGGEEQTDSHDTGIWFGGQVSMQNGRFTPTAASMGQLTINPASRILIMVWDEFAGTNDAGGNRIPAIPVYLRSASGTVQGNQAFLKFWDGYGSVSMEGQFDGQYFEGVMTFENTATYDGNGTPTRGTLGRFVVSTCAFFVCN